MAPKQKAHPAQIILDAQDEDDDEDEDIQRLDQQIVRMSTQYKEMQETMKKQQQEARTAQQDMIKRMEELITNRLSPATSIQPTPSVTPPPPGEDIVPPRLPTPSTLHAYEHFRVPTIPSIDKLKGRSNYQT